MSVCYQEQDGNAVPGSKQSSQLHKMYQSQCTAKNSWWWAERLTETCRAVIPITLEFGSSIGFLHKENFTLLERRSLIFSSVLRNFSLNRTGNVRITDTMRGVVQQLLQWESNKYCMLWVCVCSLNYPACNAHAPYCHLWPFWLYHIFHIIPHTWIFLKKKKYLTWIVLFFPQLLSETFVILKRSERDMYWFSCKVAIILVWF